MRNRILKTAAALAAALCLSATLVTGAMAAGSGSTSAGARKWADTDVTIDSNGGYFVYMDDGETEAVYYRVYGPGQLMSPALFGKFLEEANDGPVGMMMRYNLGTGETEEVFEDPCYGPVIADGRGFYGMIPEEGSSIESEYGSYTVWVSADGSETRAISDKQTCIMGASEDGSYIALRFINIDDEEYGGLAVYHEGKEAVAVVPDDGEFLTYCGMYKSLMYFMLYDSETRGNTLYCLNAKDAELTELGYVPYDPEETYSTELECRQCLTDSKGVYIVAAATEGTGQLISGFICFKARSEREDSVEVIDSDWLGELEQDELPRLMITRPGEAEAYRYVTDDVELSEGFYGDLIYHESPRSVMPVVEEFIPKPDDDLEYMEYVLAMEVIDRTIYLITAKCAHNADYDIGWRYAYDLQQANWFRIPVDWDSLDDDGHATAIEGIGYCLEEEQNGGETGLSSEYTTGNEYLDSLVLPVCGGWQMTKYQEEGRTYRARRTGEDAWLYINIFGGITYIWDDVEIDTSADVGETGNLVFTVKGNNGYIYFTLLSTEGYHEDMTITVEMDYPDDDGEYHERIVTYAARGVG